MNSDQWLPSEVWDAAVGELPPRSSADCRHAHVHHLDTVLVDGAAVAAVRCGQCGRILGTGSDG